MTKKNPSPWVLIFLLLTVTLDSIGFGIIFPVMPALIEEVAQTDLSHAATFHGQLLLAFGLMQFAFGPIIGNLSDAYGRRRVLLVALAGMVVDYILMALAPSLAWLFLGRILGGITTATYATVHAAIADFSTDANRTKNFGLVGAGFGIGFVIGPFLGGILAHLGTRAPFWGAAIIAATNLVFGYFVFRETLAHAHRRAFQWARANPLSSFALALGNPRLLPFMVVWLILNAAFIVWPSILAFFATYQFGWDAFLIGLSLAGFGVFMAFSQAVVIRPLMRRFRARHLVVMALSLDLSVFIFMSFIKNDIWIWVIFPLAALATIATPAFTDLMTRLVGRDEQGELQGLLQAIGALTLTFGPLAMTQVFAHFTAPERETSFAGAPFALSAILMVVGIGIFIANAHKLPKADRGE